ncbi:MAG: L-threonylcarbamoyladenylate synthase [Deltaproteobacteria bacterium]|nr:L-threonylcarbamoyladenylate synthase [Deltaproteobacteria bacterium]
MIIEATSVNILRVVEILLAEDVVGIPTETVYGLGGLATSAKAVRKIYCLKNRPADNPLITHFCSVNLVNKYVKFEEAGQIAERLASLWPGPLTLILPIRDERLRVSTAGLDYCGVRIPSHPICLELLDQLDEPLAAPSANKSGYCSPTKAQHVEDDFEGKILVLKGDDDILGIESTVVSLVGRPRILRLGAVPYETLAELLSIDPAELIMESEIMAPGKKYKHYSPRQKVMVSNQSPHFDCCVIKPKNTLELMKNFYSILREADKLNKTIVISCELDPRRFPDYVVFDRLKKMGAEFA